MEKCIVWYTLSLKQNIRKIGTWILLVAMLFLLWILGNVKIPDGTNEQVAIFYNDTEYEDAIKDALSSSGNQFVFIEYESEDEVYKAVESGEVECGFVCTDDFDDGIRDGEWEEIVRLYTTPFSTKTEVAKENMFAALYPIYSEWLLLETEDEIYTITDEERLEELLELNRQNLGEDLILSVEEVRIETENDNEVVKEEPNLYPMQGLVELFVLLAMLLAAGVYGQKETAQIASALLVKEKLYFRYMNILSNGTLIALVGTIALLCSSSSRGIGIEILSMLCTLGLGGVFVLGFSKLFRNRLTYLSWVVTFVICYLLLRFGIAGYITF